MVSKEVSVHIREVAKKHGISPTVLEKIWVNQFKVVKQVMESATKGEPDTFRTIYLRKMCKFVPNTFKIGHMTRNANKRKTDK